MKLPTQLRPLKQIVSLSVRLVFSMVRTLGSEHTWRYHFLASAQPTRTQNYEYIRSIEYKTPDEIRQIQEDKLRSLLTHAYNNVPYYHNILSDAGVCDGDRVDLDAFTNLPVLTKDIIREHFDELTSADLDERDWYENSSGGSTGQPLRILQDKAYAQWSASNMYFFSLGGKEYGERQINLWGSERDILKGSIGWKAKLDNFFANRTLLNTFYTSPEILDSYFQKWNRIKPVSVWAYVDSAYEFAKYAKSNGIVPHPPRVMVVTAGTLYDFQRELIEEVFQCPVLNQYGSREAGDMAASCTENAGLHLFEYSHYIEILDDNLQPVGPGEEGTVYVTSLISEAMPLIRYRIGDTARRAEAGKEYCPCGRGFTLIQHLTGRSSDHFVKADGSIIHGEYFTHVFYFMEWVQNFQVVQKEYNQIDINIVRNDREKNEDDVARIISDIQAVMGTDCELTFHYLDEIPRSKSGKYRYTVSEIAER